jgi:hypothetical protein
VIAARLSRHRRGVGLAGLLAVAALAGGAAGGAGIASGSDAPKQDATAQGTPADKQAEVNASQQPGRGVAPDLLVATRQALQGLVTDGSIDQSQADAIQTRVASGSVDVSEVIESGVATAAQMDLINAKLIAIKEDFRGK